MTPTSDALRRVLDTYFNAADSKTWDLFPTVFARDCRVTYHLGTPQELLIEGREAVLRQLEDVVSGFTASSHVLGNFHAVVAGAMPSSVTHAIANVILGDRALARGLRYIDTFVEEDGLWKIAERQHVPMWQTETRTVPPAL